MPDRPTVQWQPISMLPTIMTLAVEARDAAKEQIDSFQQAITRPGALDRATIERSLRIYTEQQEFLAIYAEQVQCWRASHPTATQLRSLADLDALIAEATTLTTELLALIRQCAEQPAFEDTPLQWLERAARFMVAGDPDGAMMEMNEALHGPWSAAWMAELYAMRGSASSALGDDAAAAEDYQRAITASEAAEPFDPIRHLRYLGFYGQAIMECDPVAAYETAHRQNRIAEQHQAFLVEHPSEAIQWPGAAVGVALIAEMLDRIAEARHWFQVAAERCATIPLAPDHELRRLIAEGLARCGR